MTKKTDKLEKRGWSWAAVPGDVILSPDLSPTDVRVYAYLLWRTNSNNESWPGVERMSSDLKVGQSWVKESLKRLVENNWIRRIRRYNTSTLTIVFETKEACMRFDKSRSATPVDDQLATPVDDQLATPVDDQLATPVDDQLATPVDVNYHQYEPQPVNHNQYEPPPAPWAASDESETPAGDGDGDNDLAGKLVDLLEVEFGIFPETVEAIMAKNTPEAIVGWLHHVVEQGNKVDPPRLLSSMLTKCKRPPKSPRQGSRMATERERREIAWGLAEPRPVDPVEVEPELVERRALCGDLVPGTLVTASDFWNLVMRNARTSHPQIYPHLDGSYPVECNGALVIAVRKQSLDWLNSERLQRLVDQAVLSVSDTLPKIEFVEAQ